MTDTSKNSKLGRGLFDLMEETAAARTLHAPPSAGGFLRIPITAIKPGPWQARLAASEDADLENLTQSIRDRGLLHPLLVRRSGEGFELIAGRRRLEAARAAGLQDAPALVTEASDQQCAELFLVENLQRKELSPEFRRRCSNDLILEFGLDPEQQKELLRLELRAPEAPQPPVIEPAPAPTPPLAPASPPAPPQEAKKSSPAIWRSLAAAVIAFALGLGLAYILLKRGTAQEPLQTAAVLQEPSIPAAPTPEPPPSIPDLALSYLRPMNPDRASLLVFENPIFQYGLVFSENAPQMLQGLAAAMNTAGSNCALRIIGHTGPDPVPANTGYRDNHALGLARAEAVFEYLRVHGGVAPDRMSATSSGRDHPPCPMDDPKARLLNKTVTIELLPRI